MLFPLQCEKKPNPALIPSGQRVFSVCSLRVISPSQQKGILGKPCSQYGHRRPKLCRVCLSAHRPQSLPPECGVHRRTDWHFSPGSEKKWSHLPTPCVCPHQSDNESSQRLSQRWDWVEELWMGKIRVQNSQMKSFTKYFTCVSIQNTTTPPPFFLLAIMDKESLCILSLYHFLL